MICRHRFAATGASAVITVNTTLAQRLLFAEYPFHVAVAIEAAARALDASGRINAHESQHLLHLSRVIREHLECEDQHLMAIVHGAGARTLEFQARDGDAIARRLTALRQEKTWIDLGASRYGRIPTANSRQDGVPSSRPPQSTTSP